MENFTVEHLVPQLVYVITSDGKVMDQVISQQPAESEDPQARRDVLDDACILDDSDDEASCTNRTKPRKWHRNFINSLIEFSCEEGEDTASSEDNETEASEEDSSNEDEEKEWRSDSSRQISSNDEDEEEEDNKAVNDQTEQTQDEDAQSSSPQKPKRKEKSETPKLQEQQDQQARGQQGTPRRVSLSKHIEVQSPPTVDLQSSGQGEGVHQMHQNAPCSQTATEMDLQACCRGVVHDLTTSAHRVQEPYRIVKGEEEITLYKQTIKHSTFGEQVESPTTKTTVAKASIADPHRSKKRRRLDSTYSSVEDSMNGFSSRSSRAERRRVRGSSVSDLEGSEDEENTENADDTDQNRQPRKTAVDAVSKMKLMDASKEEDTSEPVVIQSSSESEEHDHQDDSPCQ